MSGSDSLGRTPELQLEIFAAIRREVANLGGEEADLGRILSDKKLLSRLAAEIVAGAGAGKDPFRVRFQAAIAACRLAWVSPRITPEAYPEPVFGEIGEGHIAAQPPRLISRDFWLRDDIEAWLRTKLIEGLEPGRLADGLEFVAKNPNFRQNEPAVFWGSLSIADELVLGGPFGGGGGLGSRPGLPGLEVRQRDARWPYICVFLLRRIKLP